MKEKEIEQAKEKIKELYNKISTEENEKITNIKFCEEMIIVPQKQDNIALAEDIYVVEKEVQITKDIKEKRVELYIEEGQRVAIISKDGSVMFDEAYIELLKERYKSLFKMIKIEETKVNEQDISEVNKENEEVEMKQEELEEKQKEENQTEDQMQKNNEANMQKIATATGISKDQMKACTKFDPRDKITATEDFYDILPSAKEYQEIYVVASNENTKGNSRFHFVGITKDGMAEQLEDLKPTEGVRTSKEVISIDRYGKEIKEKQVSALFQVGNDKGFSVTIGDYGVIKAEYIRRSRDGKYITSEINTNTQRRTGREVQEFMSDTRNSRIENNIEKAEEQMDEKEDKATNIENIDDNEYNANLYYDIDKEIELEDGTTTTIREQAEKTGLSIEEYVRRCEEQPEDTIQDKIERLNEEIEEEKEQELKQELENDLEEEEGRTPWGDAWDRMNRRY